MSDSANKPSFFQAVVSTMWAFLGISKNARRHRDFEHGSPKLFIVVGVLLTLCFIFTVFLVVKLVLP